jgi:hypothetical protein
MSSYVILQKPHEQLIRTRSIRVEDAVIAQDPLPSQHSPKLVA